MEKVKLTTPVNIPDLSVKFDYNTVIMGIGSCFAQEVLQRLFDGGLVGMQNPNGILYNSISISRAIAGIAENQLYEKTDFFEHNGLWHNWNHHGDFSDRDLATAVSRANQSSEQFRTLLINCGKFVVTPSSSVVYVFKESGEIVANCHKVPNHMFERKLLSVQDNLKALKNVVDDIRKLNPECHIVFTLSPVRHYPGELLLNSRSKAHLLTAIYQCVDESENTSYFPSYEIVLDELRDYRFYREDMLHINDIAVKVIFNRFIETYFDEQTINRIKENLKKNQGKKHRNHHI